MAVTMEILRRETEIAKRAKGNIVIYGRRKVGKTFMVKKHLSPDIYVLAKRGGGFYLDGAPFSTLDSYEQFLQMLPVWLEGGRSVAIDEFQRLPPDFLDYLQTMPRKGKVILTGSSFHLVKSVISPGSPILGLYSDLRLSLISPLDIFAGLSEDMDCVRAFELSPYLRDPWTLQHLGEGGVRLGDILNLSRGSIRSLIGEVFLEEEKRLSQVYEGIIRALSLRKWKLAEIANLLYSRNIIDKPDPHFIRPYFNTMENMDIVKRLPIHGKKEFMYMLKSPIMDLGFMLDEKYDFFQQNISDHTMDEELASRTPLHVEQFCGELFAEAYDGRYEYFYTRDFDTDFIITRGPKVLAVGEVKWGEKAAIKDIGLFLERTRHLPGERILFSKRIVEDERITSLTPENLMDWVRNRRR